MNVPAVILGIALASVAVLVARAQTPATAQKPATPLVYKNLSVDEFDKLRSKTNTVVLDVRTEKEYKDGHIAGAVNINVNDRDFAALVAKLGTNKTFLVHCKAGSRSVRACQNLAPAGMTNLFNMEEGFDAWVKAGKPVEK